MATPRSFAPWCLLLPLAAIAAAAGCAKMEPPSPGMISAQQQGIISAHAAAQSRERVHSLLLRTAQNPVTALSADVFARHKAAGALFTAETAEVI